MPQGTNHTSATSRHDASESHSTAAPRSKTLRDAMVPEILQRGLYENIAKRHHILTGVEHSIKYASALPRHGVSGSFSTAAARSNTPTDTKHPYIPKTDCVGDMMHMISTQRAYESSISTIRQADKMLRKLPSEFQDL